MITIKLNCTRIDKTALYQGKNGKYLDLVLLENKSGQDQYGNTGFVTQDIGKARREAGEKGPILGNYKQVGTATPHPRLRPPRLTTPRRRMRTMKSHFDKTPLPGVTG